MKRLDREELEVAAAAQCQESVARFSLLVGSCHTQGYFKHKHIMAKLHRDDRYYTCKKLKLRILSIVMPNISGFVSHV